MEETLRAILKELQDIKEENKKLVVGQMRLEKTQRKMASDIGTIKEYQLKGQDIDVDRLKDRVKKIEEHLRIV